MAAWSYGIPESLKFRHRFIASKLTGYGWDVHVQPSLAVATTRVAAGELSRVVGETEVGWLPWFVGWDAWESPVQVAREPFRAVIVAFAGNGRLAPSLQFLEAIRERLGGIAYLVDTDAGNPSLVLVTASRLCSGLAKELPTCEVRPYRGLTP